MDARHFLGLEATDDPLRWRLPVTPAVSTPVKSIWAIPSDVEMSASQRAKLAALLAMAPAELDRKLADRSRDFVYLKRQVAPDVAHGVEALGIKGLA